jgi:2-keto-3-deoxy-L-rhamnonate aldolase RhmA
MTGAKGSELKQRIGEGETLLGSFLGFPDPLMARLFSQIGFDFLIIDQEHGAINRETLQQMLLMFNGTPTCPFVRVPWHEPAWAKWALDCGAEGILFPYVNDAQTARQVVANCKYHPEGQRGYYPKVASNFLMDLPDYLDHINERIQVWIQIEHADAIRNLDEILGVDGIDAVFIGPADLSLSLGILNQYDHPDFEAALDRIFTAAHKAGVPVVYHLYEVSENALRKGRGRADLVSFGQEWVFAKQGALKALADVRSVLKEAEK